MGPKCLSAFIPYRKTRFGLKNGDALEEIPPELRPSGWDRHLWITGKKEHRRNKNIDDMLNAQHVQGMSIIVSYEHHPATAAPRPMSAQALWLVASQVRRQVRERGDGLAVAVSALLAREVVANGRVLQVNWDMAHSVHDDAGREVLGVCETDPDVPHAALVSINARMVAGRPDLELSTAAHELGHVLFDVPAALGEMGRRFRTMTVSPEALLDRAAVLAERRANEFMGALLVPAVPFHLQMLVHARAEGLRTVHAAHLGRQGSRILAGDNPPEAVDGVVAALAGDFGVSDGFVRVRLARYRLIEGGLPS